MIYRDPTDPEVARPAKVVRAVGDDRYRISLTPRSEASPNRLAASQTDRLDETMTTLGEGPLDPEEDLEVAGATLEREPG